jgi:hypothetical protein
MVVMDVFIRRTIGFGVERADIDGVAVCRMFQASIAAWLGIRQAENRCDAPPIAVDYGVVNQ